jgi:hypothetical protein
MEVGVKIIGDRRIALRFEEFPEQARAALVEVVTDLQRDLQDSVRAAMPKDHTGKLSASLAGGVENSPTRVRGWVNVAGKNRALILQAMALEYGSHANIAVSAKAGRRLSTVYGHYISPIEVLVGAYNRTANIEAVRFLRGPLADMAEAALERMSQAVQGAAEASA